MYIWDDTILFEKTLNIHIYIYIYKLNRKVLFYQQKCILYIYIYIYICVCVCVRVCICVCVCVLYNENVWVCVYVYINYFVSIWSFSLYISEYKEKEKISNVFRLGNFYRMWTNFNFDSCWLFKHFISSFCLWIHQNLLIEKTQGMNHQKCCYKN